MSQPIILKQPANHLNHIFSFLPKEELASNCQLVSKKTQECVNKAYPHISQSLFSDVKKNIEK